MLQKTWTFAVVAALAFQASGDVFETITVDFDDQTGGIPPVVTDGLFNDYVSFSTTDGDVLLIFGGAGFVGGSDPNVLTAAESADASVYDSDIYMDFTDAVQNVSLDIVADNDSGVIAMLRVFHSGGESLLDVVGNGDFNDAIPTDLSAFSDVTRIELVGITDEFGLSIDNLVFDVKVPAPGSLGVLAIGALAATRRRRR